MGTKYNELFGVFVILCVIPQLTADSEGRDEVFNAALNDVLNTCMDGRHHKSLPGPEDSLHAWCAPWGNRSCCTAATSISAHYDKMYNFDWNHCSHVSPLSDKCRHRFHQDLCFYECSPNVGPWLVKVQQKIRNERFINVPLCRSDCEAWYNDCQNDYTCTDNWGLNFNWVNGYNRCPTASICTSFGKIFKNATYFCETVWDHSWKVVDDSEHCMRLWFDPVNGNPNDAVAKWKAEELLTYQMSQLKAAEENSAGINSSKNAMMLILVSFTILASNLLLQN